MKVAQHRPVMLRICLLRCRAPGDRGGSSPFHRIFGVTVPFDPKRKVLTDYAATALLVELSSARRAP